MRFYIETYGCQMNTADSELVSDILLKAGFEQTQDIDDAGLLIFNTCTVRQHAENRVLGRIASEKQRKQTQPGLKIAVIGCVAQKMGEMLIELENGIDYVVGVDQYQLLPELLAHDTGIQTTENHAQLYQELHPRHQNPRSAYVTITRGCDNFCSYCIVPYVRGRERSLPPGWILDEVRKCGESGRKEVTLLGQNVNSYCYGDYDFPRLLSELNGIDSIYRLRFLSSHPKDLSDQLIETMVTGNMICPQIHLPLQSGDDHILQAMNRKYKLEHYLGLVDKLRKAMPDIAITTDILIGFPGETELMFQNTIKAMQEIRFDYAFCFKYSPREQTAAAKMGDQVPEIERLRRLQTTIELQREITRQKYQEQIGKFVEVYVESLSRRSAKQVAGKTRSGKIAVLAGNEQDLGHLKTARVASATGGTLICD